MPQRPLTNPQNEESPQEAEKNQAEQPRIPTLRTYKSDVSRALKEGGKSLTQITLAAQRRRRGEEAASETSAKQRKRWGFFLLSSFLVLAGAGALAATGWYLFFNPEQERGAERRINQPFIFAEEQKGITLEELTRTTVRARVSAETSDAGLRLGQVRQLFFTRQNRSGETSESPAPIAWSEIFTATTPAMPPQLLRSIDGRVFYGLYAHGEVSPFLIIGISSFEQAFAGMIAWEGSLPSDAAPVLDITTGTRNPFRDILIRNQDVRIQRNNGETTLLYAFPRRDVLVITPDETTFLEVLNRLATPRISN